MNDVVFPPSITRASAKHNHRVENTPVYVLHRHPYSESSLILELFSREHGNLPVLAKGAKRPNSALRSTLMLFQPLLATFSGKHEVRTLQRAEWTGGLMPLPPSALLSAYYLNELLLKLLPREDAHPALFDAYTEGLQALSSGQSPALVLRRFEKTLLRELGYALHFDCDAAGARIDVQRYYQIHHEQGVIEASADLPEAWPGKLLLAIAEEKFDDPSTQQQARNLMRMLLNRHLDGRRLKTRQILLDMQSYGHAE
jgi:DNA repair protein RecO (recombination protein O)